MLIKKPDCLFCTLQNLVYFFDFQFIGKLQKTDRNKDMRKLALTGILLCLTAANLQALTMEDAAGRIERSGEIDTDLLVDGKSVVSPQLKLTTDPEYLAAKKVEFTNNSEVSSWETRLAISVVATIVTGLYSYSEYLNAQDQLKDMEANDTRMSNAIFFSEARSYYTRANKNREAIDNHNQGMQNGMILSTLLAGYSIWVWMGEPEKAGDLSWRSTITPQGAQLVYTMRW